jgi:GTP-binding protein EngB required for normal cell division
MKSDKQSEINIMVLGPAGVGKGSLINYLYGSKVAKVGAGLPKTPRGEFQKVPLQSPLKPEIKINIFDSWGLESNKAEDWKNEINSKLSSTLSFDDMIYGIVYCTSYSNGRIQDFEIEMLKELLSKDYKVVIALTKADNGGYETKKKAFRDKLEKELPEHRGNYSVIDICAQAKPKLGQTESSTSTFGKEVFFEALENDIFVNFVKVIYSQWIVWKDESREQLRRFKQEGTAKILKFNGPLLSTKKTKADIIAKELEGDLRTLAGSIFEKIKNGTEDILHLYQQVSGAFFSSERQKRKLVELTTAGDILFKILIEITTLRWLIFSFVKKAQLQQQLIEELDGAVEKIDQKILDIYSQAEKLFWELERK